MSRDSLLARVHSLAESLAWPADKQQAWLTKRGASGWASAPDAVLTEGIEYMEHFGKMFGTALDGVSGQCNTTGSRNSSGVSAREHDLRIYLGEDGNVDESKSG